MFTGIIRQLGIVKEIAKSKNAVTFTIEANLIDKKTGDSIAVNGVCVTIIKNDETGFKFEAIGETMEKTNLKDLKKGSRVNLEPALKLNQGLDGHLVQGHIDALGKVTASGQHADKATLTISFPEKIAKYLAFKGSITISGVSLTISDLQAETFSVELIPHTLKNTNLSELKKGDQVNLETDLIARHLDRLLEQRDAEAKYEYLKERNLI